MGNIISNYWKQRPQSGTLSSQEILDILRSTPFMRMIDDEALLQTVAPCFESMKYMKGTIIKNEIWSFVIVAEGAVDICFLMPGDENTKTGGENINPMVLCKRRKGDYVSGAAKQHLLGRLMEEKGKSRSSMNMAKKKYKALLDLNLIIADNEVGCTLIQLHRDRYFKWRSSIALDNSRSPPSRENSGLRSFAEKIRLLDSMIESEVVNYLSDIPFLENVEESRLVTLANLCSYAHIRAGETLCEEGAVGDRFYICLLGILEASVKTAVNPVRTTPAGHVADEERKLVRAQPLEIRTLRRMAPGAYFGEISLLFKIPRTATIKALADSLVVYVDRATFCNFLKLAPEALSILYEYIRQQFFDALVTRGCGFLHAIPLIKLQELSTLGVIEEHSHGSDILRYGDENPNFYILLRGCVTLSYTKCESMENTTESNGERKFILKDSINVPKLEQFQIFAGGYFGEEAFIFDSLTSLVTATCDEDCLTIKLSRLEFLDFFACVPEVYSEFCIKCLREKSLPEHVMHHYEAHLLWGADCMARQKINEIKLFENIEDFSWDADPGDSRTQQRALAIYLKFLSESAPQKVEVDEDILRCVEEKLNSHWVDASLFTEVRHHIFSSMNNEAFEKFKASALFQELLGRLHCPGTIYDNLTKIQICQLSMTDMLPELKGSERQLNQLPRKGTVVVGYRQSKAGVNPMGNPTDNKESPQTQTISNKSILNEGQFTHENSSGMQTKRGSTRHSFHDQRSTVARTRSLVL